MCIRDGFCPKRERACEEEEEQGERVVLPLHQQLAMMRTQHPGLSKGELLRLITKQPQQERTDPWANAACAEAEEPCSEEAALAVEEEVVAEAGGVERTAEVLSMDVDQKSVLTLAPGVGLRNFAFDALYPAETEQEAIYDGTARKMVMDVLNLSLIHI